MKIKTVNIVNFKKISSAQITFGELITKVSGKNGAGKSSIYDAIWTALLGKEYVGKGTSAEKLITRGETKSEITVKLEGTDKIIKVRRKINESGEMYLEAIDSDMNKLNQKDINALCSSYAVDPLEFTRLSAKDQFSLVQSATGLDTSTIDAKHQIAYDKRKEANSIFNNYRTQLEAMGEVKETKRVNTQDLSLQLQTINAKNQQVQEKGNSIEAGKNYLNQVDASIEEMENQIKEIQVKIDAKKKLKIEATEKLNNLEKEHSDMTIIETDHILKQLADADTINKEAEKWDKYQELKQQTQVSETKAIQLDSEVKALLDEKAQMIKDANMPIDGMEISEKDGVIINGLPFSQYSTAEQIIMACRIATATNPEIKLIGIKDGSLLDDDTMLKLETFAEECGYQFYLERVGEEVDGLVIRDGEIVVPYNQE